MGRRNIGGGRDVGPARAGRRGWGAAAVLLALLGLAAPLGGQVPGALPGPQPGAVEGRIRDDVGAAVYAATALLEGADGLERMAESDRLGFFRLVEVAPGSYRLRITRLGHAPFEREVAVTAGARVVVEVVLPRAALEVAGVGVEATRSRERVRFEEVAGATVRELGLDDLRRIPGVAEADVLRAVEVLPGVVSTSDFSSAFHVRGGSSDQNLILLDGLPVLSPFHLGGLFSVFNADMLARAQLASGGFPARFGGRVSSVLDIESAPGEGRFRVDGGVSMLATRVAVADDLPGGALGLTSTRWRLSARRSYFDQLLKPAFEFPYHLTDLQGVIEGWTTRGDRLRITAYRGADVLDFTGIDPDDFPLRIDWDWGNDVVGASWSRARGGGGALDVAAGFTQYGTGLRFPDFSDTSLRSRIRQGLLRAELRALPRPGWRVGVGASADLFRYDNLFASGGTEFARGAGSGWLLGGFAQAEWLDQREWAVEAGVRVDGWMPDPGETVIEASPRLAVKRFVAGGDVALKGAVGRYTQFLHSVRDEELPIGLDVWVLAGERAPHVVSDQLQAGVEAFLGEAWQLSLEGYWRRFDGVVTVNGAEDPNDPLDDMLRGRGTSYGWDLLARRTGDGVSGWVALSWLKARRTFPDVLDPIEPRREVTYPPVFDRRLDVDLVLQVPVPGGWQGGLRWNFGTGVPFTRALASYTYYSPRLAVEDGRLFWQGAHEDTDTFGGYAVHLAQRNSSRYPAYHRLDVSVRKTMTRDWGTFTPYLDVLNVYNRKNVLFYFYEYEKTPPVRSGISMFPLLPTLGVEVSFR
jgi:hypothetical protein